MMYADRGCTPAMVTSDSLINQPCPPHAYVFKGLSEDESQWVWQCVKCPHQDVEAIDGD